MDTAILSEFLKDKFTACKSKLEAGTTCLTIHPAFNQEWCQKGPKFVITSDKRKVNVQHVHWEDLGL